MTVKYDEHQLPDWVRDSVLRYRDATNAALADDVIREHLKHYLRQLCLAIDGSIEDVLAWFSGKDLMTALAPAAYRSIAPGPKELRQKLRNWVRNNPDHAISLFPEWHALRELLRR